MIDKGGVLDTAREAVCMCLTIADFFFRAEIRPFFLISIKSGRELIYIHTYNMHAFSEYLLNEKILSYFLLYLTIMF